MNPIEIRLKNVESLLIKIPAIVREETIKQSKFISKLNQEQLLDGRKADDSLMPSYVPGSDQPSAPGQITLFASGDFHGGIEPLFEDKGFDMIGLDFKTQFLVAKFGKILNLTKESIIKLRAMTLPNIIKRSRALI